MIPSDPGAEPPRDAAAGDCLPDWRLGALAAGETAEADEAVHLDRCETCRAALEAARDENDLLAGVSSALTSPARDTSPERDAPEGYRFIEEIHRGAQGVVYLAEQLSAKRRVAVKLTLRGAFASARQRARFDREVELAASIKHPAVVTVYESGATPSGGRYMAMEFVEGLPLDRWFESRRRDPERVARVMAAIAGGVEAAHRKGVIHRDLKPSNILVDASDEPKLVDFGIAKALRDDAASQTQAGEFVGTLAYAAPEQVAGEPDAVDIRADVYALGALLYEGLTAERPVNLEGSLTACIRHIREEPPAPPSAIDPSVPRDLSAIALEALEKDPARRYQTAGALREDLERFLVGEAVLARGPDSLYRFRKWAVRRRKRLAFAGAALLALAITAALAIRAANERSIRDAAGELVTIPLRALDTELSNERVVTLNDYLKNMATVLAQEIPEAPEFEAKVRSSLGIALTRESAFEDAEAELARALALWRSAKGPGSPEAAQALHDLARMHWKASDYDAAEPLYREALAIRRRALPEGDLETARTAHHLASTVQRLGRFDEAVALYEEALAARRAALGPDAPAVANTLHGLGQTYYDRRRLSQALQRFRDSHRIVSAAAGENDWRTASAAANLARVLAELGQTDDARELLERSLATDQSWWPPDDPRVLRTRLWLAKIENDPGEIASIRETISLRLGERHAFVAEADAALARALVEAREPDAAIEAGRRAAEIAEARDPDGWLLAETLLIEAEALQQLDRLETARERLERARAILTREFDLEPNDPLRARLARVSADVEDPPRPRP